jgi:hypothetical protein
MLDDVSTTTDFSTRLTSPKLARLRSAVRAILLSVPCELHVPVPVPSRIPSSASCQLLSANPSKDSHCNCAYWCTGCSCINVSLFALDGNDQSLNKCSVLSTYICFILVQSWCPYFFFLWAGRML